MDNLYLSNDELKEMLRAGKLYCVTYTSSSTKNDVYFTALVKTTLTSDKIKKLYDNKYLKIVDVSVATMDDFRPGRVISVI